MTQEEKDLLLKDLCARLPYKVKVLVDYIDENNVNDILNCLHIIELKNYTGDDSLINIKPYLRPMSSMTEEEIGKMWNIWENDAASEAASRITDFLNEKHLDHHHLIEKGLALEAPKGMYC